jgi:hypothetical protein
MVCDRGTWRGKLSCARFAEENAAGEKAAADAMNGSIDIHMIIFLVAKASALSPTAHFEA